MNNGSISDSSSDDGSGDKIRVGKDYQATIPDLIPVYAREEGLRSIADKALLVWTPTKEINDGQLDEYLLLAKEKYKYNAEQALGMLFWHKFDLQRAVSDLSNFQPFPLEWSPRDKMIFEQRFLYSGKNFREIRQSLPEKSIGALVSYYYYWKKTRSCVSLMDHQVKKFSNNNNNSNVDKSYTNAMASDITSEQGSNTDSDTDDTVKEEKDSSSSSKSSNKCSNCSMSCTNIRSTSKGGMCRTCMLHFKNTGFLRPTVGSVRGRFDRHGLLKNTSTPPRDMYINNVDLVSLAAAGEVRGNALRKIDREIASLKHNVQDNRQKISHLKCQVPVNIDSYREPDVNTTSRITSRWTNDELLLAVQGIRKFGKDFKAVAEIIGTKTETHVKVFFTNYKQRYNLDAVLKEYETENGIADVRKTEDNLNSSTESLEMDDKDVTSVDESATLLSSTRVLEL